MISTLLDKKLITTAGRKEVIGRPILYKTSKEFLMRFGLSDLDELPKEFEALAREALGSDEGVSADISEDHVSELHPETDMANIPTAIDHVQHDLAQAEQLREEEVAATAEGMPSDTLDEEPPKADAKSAGE